MFGLTLDSVQSCYSHYSISSKLIIHILSQRHTLKNKLCIQKSKQFSHFNHDHYPNMHRTVGRPARDQECDLSQR